MVNLRLQYFLASQRSNSCSRRLQKIWRWIRFLHGNDAPVPLPPTIPTILVTRYTFWFPARHSFVPCTNRSASPFSGSPNSILCHSTCRIRAEFDSLFAESEFIAVALTAPRAHFCVMAGRRESTSADKWHPIDSHIQFISRILPFRRRQHTTSTQKYIKTELIPFDKLHESILWGARKYTRQSTNTTPATTHNFNGSHI